MPPLLRYCLKRLVFAVPTLVLVVAGNFLLLRLAPGDLAEVMAGEAGAASPEYMAQLRHDFGLDQPLWAQFVAYADRLLHFDLGFSFRFDEPVSALLLHRLGATVLLMLVAIGIALLFGIVLGALAARFRGSILDEAISLLATIGFAVPLFWIGMMAIVLFAVKLEWLPLGGMSTIGGAGRGWLSGPLDIARHLVLPAGTLSIFFVALYARMTRAAMLEVYQHEFVRTARAKGISEFRLVVHHVLRNALLPIVTLTGLQLGTILGGSIVIETVFSWPGLGRLAFDAVAGRDFNLLLGIFLCNCLLVIAMNLIVDLCYAFLDPRVEVQA